MNNSKSDKKVMPKKNPNILLIYADDLGFGDISCYGAQNISTPNLDRLAVEGCRFTNGHAAAATCTPARYGLLTGAYPFRHPRARILAGDSMSLFVDGHRTIAQKLQYAGYQTGIAGKWHLGLGDGRIDWNGEISFTPNDAGFKSSYIMASTNDRVPCVYLNDRRIDHLDIQDPISVSYQEAERERFINLPTGYPTGYGTGRDNPEQLKLKYDHGHDGSIVNGVSRIGYMKGAEKALWQDENMGEVFVGKAREFIRSNKDESFFLFYALHQPHVPRLPAHRFVGSTPYGARGDAIVELDWCVGEVLKELERCGIRDDTLIIFSSDNGPVLQDGYADEAEERGKDHKQAGPLRGGKYSLFDGGTRVPLILCWPNVIPKGVTSSALIGQIDFYASLVALLGLKLSENEAPDSMDMSDVLLGFSEMGRGELITEGSNHNTLLQSGDWIFIPPYDGPRVSPHTHIELGNSKVPQLYHIGHDIGQRQNLARQEPDLTLKLAGRLKELLEMPFTRPLSDISKL